MLGGFLIQFAWWGSIFLVNGPIVLAAIVLTVLMVPESTSTARKLDVPGVVLSVAWSTALVYGIIQAGNLATIADPRVYVPLVLGVVLLVVFILVELRSAAPALDLRLVSDRRVAGATSAVTLAFFVNFGVPFFLIFYLQSVLGVSPLMTGLAILPLALALAVFSPRSAALSAKFGPKNVLVGGLSLLAVGVAIFALLDQNSPLWPVFVADFLVGLAMANVMPPATTTIMSAVPRERAGVGSALTNMGRSIGGAIGIAVLGSLLTVVYRNGVEPALSVLPSQSRAAAGDSIEATKAAAAGLGGTQGADLFAAGADAFSVAMRATALAAAGAAVLAAIVVLVVVPLGNGGRLRCPDAFPGLERLASAGGGDQRELLRQRSDRVQREPGFLEQPGHFRAGTDPAPAEEHVHQGVVGQQQRVVDPRPGHSLHQQQPRPRSGRRRAVRQDPRTVLVRPVHQHSSEQVDVAALGNGLQEVPGRHRAAFGEASVRDGLFRGLSGLFGVVDRAVELFVRGEQPDRQFAAAAADVDKSLVRTEVVGAGQRVEQRRVARHRAVEKFSAFGVCGEVLEEARLKCAFKSILSGSHGGGDVSPGAMKFGARDERVRPQGVFPVAAQQLAESGEGERAVLLAEHAQCGEVPQESLGGNGIGA